jgi:hypothetical protein
MKNTSALITALMLAPVSTLHSTAPSKPNILFIYMDDQSYDALSIVQVELGEKGRFP